MPFPGIPDLLLGAILAFLDRDQVCDGVIFGFFLGQACFNLGKQVGRYRRRIILI
jgi:hypothetical protein